MATVRSHLVSEADFLALPESLQKIELLDGEVIVAPAPLVRHQDVVRRIVVALSNWAAAGSTPVFVGQSPIDVRFGEGRILQPDAFVVLAAISLDHRGPLDRVPDLCIEVLSTDRVYDRITKRSVYAGAGVREYWVVDAAGFVERWTGPGLAHREEIDGSLTTSLLPGFELEVGSLFAS